MVVLARLETIIVDTTLIANVIAIPLFVRSNRENVPSIGNDSSKDTNVTGLSVFLGHCSIDVESSLVCSVSLHVIVKDVAVLLIHPFQSLYTITL